MREPDIFHSYRPKARALLLIYHRWSAAMLVNGYYGHIADLPAS